MLPAKPTGLRRKALVRCALASTMLVIAAALAPASADAPATTLTALLDRAQIEDMLVAYYGQLGAGRHDFGSFYVADGVIDVNGLVAEGQGPIEDLYKKIAQGAPQRRGTFRMLLTNPRIVVHGRYRHGRRDLDGSHLRDREGDTAIRRAGPRAR